MNKFYINKKGRLITVLLLVIAMQLGITAERPVGKELNNEQMDYIYITADYGDTIWSLTQKYYEKIYNPHNLDFRDLVNYIIDINDGYNIVEGDQIKFPTK